MKCWTRGIFMALLWISAVCATKSYSPSDLKNPMLGPKEASFCGRPDVAKSAICDPDNLMDKQSKDTVESLMNRAKNAEMAVVVINSMSTYFKLFQTVEASAEKFARQIHDTWGVGDAKTNNGLVVFLSVADRAWFVSTGKGVMDRITPMLIDQVMNHAKDKLRANSIGAAVEGIVGEFELLLASEPDPSFQGRSGTSYFSWISSFLDSGWLVWGMIIGVIGMAVHGRRKQDQMTRGKVALDRLLIDVQNMQQGNKFKSSSCPICLEDFAVDYDNVKGDVEDSKSKTELLPKGKKVVSLRCGHIFCRDCIVSHINSSNGDRCPICREPIDNSHDLPPSSRLSRLSCSRYWNNPSSSANFSAYPHPEVHYRLHRMRSVYPHVITNDSYHELTTALDSNQLDRFLQAGRTRVTAVNAALIEMRKSNSGSSGSSRSSFGGGRSSGGRGGRW